MEKLEFGVQYLDLLTRLVAGREGSVRSIANKQLRNLPASSQARNDSPAYHEAVAALEGIRELTREFDEKSQELVRNMLGLSPAKFRLVLDAFYEKLRP